MTPPDQSTGSTSPTSTGRAPDPPGPKGHPYFGSLAEIRDNPMDFYVRVSQKYGGIARFYYGRNPTYLVSEPALIKELLVDHRPRYMKNKRYAELKALIGEGLLLSEGEVWQRQRSASAPAFRREKMHERVPQMIERIDAELDTWNAFVKDGGPVNTEPILSLISQTLICDFILGIHNLELAGRINVVLKELMDAWPKPPRTILEGYKLPSPRKVKYLKRCLANLDACFREAIADARAGNTDGVLGTLIAHHDDEGGFTDQELRDQLITLYMAGFETSASTTTWLFYRLAMHPEIRKQLYAEVAEVLGGRPPTPADLPKLDLTKRAIQETLRIYPPAYNFSRIALQDDVIGGYHIPKDRMVIVAPWATHRLTKYWPNPEGFDPDRFLPERMRDRPGMAYIPFGAGHRVCIGAALATLQLTLTVARIAQRYVLDLEPAHHVEHVPGTVMRPRDGMLMRISEL